MEFYKDPIAVGSFHAVQNGIVVVSSAGNSGPVPGSVGNVAPWMLQLELARLTVSSLVRKVTLGNNKHLKGTSLSPEGLRPARMFYRMISGADANNSTSTSDKARLCLPGSLDPKKVKGKILVCVRGENARTEKGEIAAVAGAVGMILVNNQEGGDETLADPHVLPAIQLKYTDGNHIFDYLNSTKNASAHITPVRTVEGTISAPVMAGFSSRGPSFLEPSILKPDITAPGVNILAAFTEAVGPTRSKHDERRTPFITLSGTSMSCPHVSGIVGLLKTLLFMESCCY